MQIEEMEVKTGSNTKKLVFVGEFHIYNNNESNEARKLLDKHKFDYGFFESPNIREPTRTLFNLFFKYSQILTRRNQKTLGELAKESGMTIFGLEGKLPIKTEIGLSFFVLFFFFAPMFIFVEGVSKGLFSFIWRFVVILLIYTVGFNWAIQNNFDDNDELVKFLPVNKVNRDEIMSLTLMKYIKEKDFKKALVVVGSSHLSNILERLKAEYNNKK